MTQAPEVEQQEVEIEQFAGIQSGVPGYITLSNVIFAEDTTNIYVRCDTDQLCRLMYRMWREDTPQTVLSETESAPAVGKRYQALLKSGLGAGDHSGKQVFIELSVPVPPNPATPILRPYTGVYRIGGARTVAKGNAVNVRWNSFTWNRYTWAQYNPKNEAALVTP